MRSARNTVSVCRAHLAAAAAEACQRAWASSSAASAAGLKAYKPTSACEGPASPAVPALLTWCDVSARVRRSSHMLKSSLLLADPKYHGTAFRGRIITKRDNLWGGAPFKQLTEGVRKSGGRNSTGTYVTPLTSKCDSPEEAIVKAAATIAPTCSNVCAAAAE